MRICRYKPGYKTVYQLRAAKAWATKRAQGNDKGITYRGCCPQRARSGVPNGMRKEEAYALRAEARVKAGAIMDEIIPVAIPGSDEEKAKAALTELCVIALSPGNAATKIAAAGKVLEYTKAKPAQKQDVKISTAEQWLASVIADNADAK